jgi:hypothetical protein
MEDTMWTNVKAFLPLDDKRVLVFSPIYPKGHEMRFRVVNGQFVRLMGEVTHWRSLEPLVEGLKCG